MPKSDIEQAKMSIIAWSRRARKGEALVYHTGLLMRDRQRAPVLDAVANILWGLCEKGLVSLVQHRSGDFKYEYLAIKR